MASRTLVSASLGALLCVHACKVPEATSPSAPASPSEEGTSATPGESGTSADASSDASAPESSAAPETAAPGAPPAPAAAPVGPSERPGPPLPELRVKSFGLPVGGAAKDTELRGRVQRTLERGFPRYLDCYRLIEEPGSEGTFGADLRVASEGGRAKVDQPRTKLKGEAFRACMIKAFESARFEPPPSGRAVVVSYSVKFSFGW
ncbi:MAG TPA: hypothetical protein VFZ53_20025 [Polyangiaceae bacterium]